ncbi:MAG: LysR family transcriptional regulator [Coriobacteriia bacterium]|nr:LysR family transcriptional regulator [Coriobacteriia bacterium]
MEIQQLEQFVTIAECENLTKAAQKLHVSQPSLSRSLHALEDELGTILFDRIGRNIVLNNAGRIALERTLVALNSLDIIKRDVEEYNHETNRTVNVYAPVPMGNNEEIIIEFKRTHPDIHLRVGTYNTTYSDRLKRLRPDITFFASPIVHKEPNYLMLGEEDIVLAVAKKNPLAQRESVQLKQLSQERFIGLLPSTLYDIVNHMFLEAGFEPNVVLEDQHYSRIMAYVAADFGLTLAPAITWFGRWKSDVAGITISDVHRKRYLYLKWPENSVMNEATLRFREYLVDYYNKNYGFTCGL